MLKIHTKYLQEIWPKKLKLNNGDVIYAQKRLITLFSNDNYVNKHLQYIYDYYINDKKVSYIKIMEFCKNKQAIEVFKVNTDGKHKKTYWKQKIGYCNPYEYIQ
jgi:hypothetical protein